MAMKQSTCRIEPIGEGLAARASGIDLKRPTDNDMRTISAALKHHPVLVFPDQPLDAPELLAFTAHFGTHEPHVNLAARHADHPELSWLRNVRADGTVDDYGQFRRAAAWHADGSFKARPDTFSFLCCHAAPSRGGETEFLDMRNAYERLPAAVKAQLEGLRACHHHGRGPASSATKALTPEQEAAYPPVEHPVVRTDPDTGRKSLYVNPVHTSHIVGWEPAESRALLEFLYAHGEAEPVRYEHRWQAGDLVMWDQRCTWHRAAGGNPPGEPRIMLRSIVVAGPPPA